MTQILIYNRGTLIDLKNVPKKSIFSAILQHQKHMSLLSWHSWTVYSDVLCKKPCNLADFVMKLRHTSAVAKVMATGNILASELHALWKCEFIPRDCKSEYSGESPR